MDVWKSPYYSRINAFLTFHGHWPGQSIIIKIRNQIFIMLAVLSIYVPYWVNIYENRNNFHEVLLTLPPTLYNTQFILKSLYAFIKENEIKQVLEAMQRDFQIYSGGDLETLHDFSKKGKKFNNFYTGYMLMAVATYGASPLILYSMDIFMPLNETRLPKPRPMIYHIDILDNSFMLMLIHTLIVDYISMIFIIGFDTLYLSISYHASGLFAAIAKKIHDTVNEEFSISDENMTVDPYYHKFTKIIAMHANVLEFVQGVDDAFATLNLISIGCSMIPLVVTGFEASQNQGNASEMMRYILFALAELIHLFYYNWPGQKIQEHSILVNSACYECEWYKEKFSAKSKKVMNLMLMRGQKPCYMTAGKVYVLGLENFASIVKVSMSYFTVLTSIT